MIIKTYKELEQFYKMFAQQTCDLLIVMSKGGLGKTSMLKKVMKNTEFVYINTHSTPLQTYKTLFDKQDCPVVMDDMDAVLKNNIFVSMLKALADTKPIKELHYSTTSKLIGNAPESFKTASNACLILNEFDVNNKALQPILDRGFYVEFLPGKKEIMKKIRQISKAHSTEDEQNEVLAFLEKNACKIDDFSLRTYQKALQLYRFDKSTWKPMFMKMIGFNEKVIKYLELKEKHQKDKDRINDKEWIWSRPTYFRIKQEVEN